MANTDISIVMLTYYHEEYLTQAIESILMQNTEYSFEILIGDDCSSDKTPQIILKYAEKYPNIINPVLRKENIGATANLLDLISKCNGRYIAILEGDDYWTEPQKLQKQVDFLKNNPEYSACYTQCNVVDKNSHSLTEQPQIGTNDSEYTLENFCRLQLPGQTGTVVFKNCFENNSWEILKTADKLIGDRTLALILLKYGNIKVLYEKMTAYRMVTDSSSKSYSAKKEKNEYGRIFNIYNLFTKYAKIHFNEAITYINQAKCRIFLASLKYALKTKRKNDVNTMFTCLKSTNLFNIFSFLLNYKKNNN